MAQWLKQSTAITLKFGPFVDDGDGKTAETALTIQKADVRLSKNGSDMAAANANQGTGDAGAPHDELGYYDLSLDATDTAAAGRLKVMVSKAGALPVWMDLLVLPAGAYDALVAETGTIRANVVTMKGADASTQVQSDVTAAIDALPITAPTGPAATWPRMLVQLWRRFFQKAALDRSANTLTTFADDGTTVLTTQSIDQTATTETQGAAT